MSSAKEFVTEGVLDSPPLAVRMAQALCAMQPDTVPGAVSEKVKICLFDLIGCGFEARHLPWSRQARHLAEPIADGTRGANVIALGGRVSVSDAAFANAVMGHGLVREDMHAGSISHLGIVVLPSLLALAQGARVSGRTFIAAAVAGYETGGQLGRAIMDADVARIHRPTGVCGPLAAAAAGARLLGLDEAQATTALALGANLTVGFNQWAHTGGSEMFFHAGYAARNAVTAVRLAADGAFASPSALDGEAGLFAAFGKRAAARRVVLFAGEPEILSVYHKPVPACNFAQTASQAALRLARACGFELDDVAAITVRVPLAGKRYPGCDHTGPFAHLLQAKMSIQYNVAAALIAHGVSEKNFALLDDARLHRLIGLMTLDVDDAMTRAYPGQQGGEVEIRCRGGALLRERLDDVVNASAAEVRARFRAAVSEAGGAQRARDLEDCIEQLPDSDDAGRLGALLGGAL